MYSMTNTNTLPQNNQLPRLSRTRMVTLIGVFAAISTILMYIELPIPLHAAVFKD